VLGRKHELGVISEFLAEGPSPTAALLLEGAAGIGKTTLWQRAGELAQEWGYRVLSSRPAEPDSGLSFAGVGDPLAGVIDGVLAELSGAQRSALEVALLLTDSADHPERRRRSGARGAGRGAAGSAPDGHGGPAQPGGAVRAASHGARTDTQPAVAAAGP